jgi:hypothetical protein
MMPVAHKVLSRVAPASNIARQLHPIGSARCAAALHLYRHGWGSP